MSAIAGPFTGSPVAGSGIRPSFPKTSFAALAVFSMTVLAGSAFPAREAFAQTGRAVLPEFAPCGPESDESADLRDGMGQVIPGAIAPSMSFCADWNPEFPFNGHHCCSKISRSPSRARGKRRSRRASKTCTMDRFKPNFCDEMTDEQRAYAVAVATGKVPDVLATLEKELGRNGDQAYCTVNNGFLAWGRPIVSTPTNRIVLSAADRCSNFGTDLMAVLLESTGRQVAANYPPGVKLVVGDVAAPRGGCLAGRNGPKGHASHTTGQDADIGFLTPPGPSRDPEGYESPSRFHTKFDAKANWWLIKQLFRNDYVCVKRIFLDKSLKRALDKHVRYLARVEHQSQELKEWSELQPFIMHMPGHKNHLHVRIGAGKGQPGCSAGFEEDLEELEEMNEDDLTGLEELLPSANRSTASAPDRNRSPK